MALYFPALTKKPSLGVMQRYDDPAIKTKMESGLSISRPRYAKVRRSYRVTYNNVPRTDLDMLDDFVRNQTVGGANSFIWVDPRTAEEITVRFAKLPEPADAGWATQKNGDRGNTYSFSFEVEEV